MTSFQPATLICRLVVLAAACLLTSCVTELKKPLLTTENSVVDADLLGQWKGRSEGDAPFKIEKGPPMTNSLRIVQAEEEFRVYCRELAGMNLMQFSQKKDGVDSHRLLAYEITGDRLLFYLLDDDALKKAIRAGELKGAITPRGSGAFSSGEDVAITDEPEQVEAYLKKRGKAAFFPEGLHFATRVKE